MITVRARRRSGWVHDVEMEGGHRVVVDEPPEVPGSADAGPSPTRLLAAALASCVAVTVEMYAERKGWELGAVEVEVEMEYEGYVPRSFVVTLRVPEPLDAEQAERIEVIASRCPVHRALANEGEIMIEDRLEVG